MYCDGSVGMASVAIGQLNGLRKSTLAPFYSLLKRRLWNSFTVQTWNDLAKAIKASDGKNKLKVH